MLCCFVLFNIIPKQLQNQPKHFKMVIRDITTVKQVDGFCRTNIYSILQQKQRWIVIPADRYAPARSEAELVLFQAAMKLIGCPSILTFFKTSSKEKRRTWARDFDGAIRNWFNREFPGRVHFTEIQEIQFSSTIAARLKKTGGEKTSDCATRECLQNYFTYAECGTTCDSHQECDNREVQVIGNSQWKDQMYTKVISKAFGVGLFAKRKLFAGEYLGFVAGEALDKKSYLARKNDTKLNSYIFGVLKPGSVVQAIDPMHFGNHTRFFNHHCAPNCIFEVWSVNNQFVVKFRVADGFKKDFNIQPGTELTVNYDWDCEAECYCTGKAFRHDFTGKRFSKKRLIELDELMEKENAKVNESRQAEKKKKKAEKTSKTSSKMSLRSSNQQQ